MYVGINMWRAKGTCEFTPEQLYSTFTSVLGVNGQRTEHTEARGISAAEISIVMDVGCWEFSFYRGCYRAKSRGEHLDQGDRKEQALYEIR